MNLSAELLFDTAEAIVKQLRATQIPAIEQAAQIIAERCHQDGVIHIFGAGHSRAFAMELAGRAGGVACAHAIGLEEVAHAEGQRDVPINLPDLERDPATAHKLLSLIKLHENDVFIIVSNSGRNGAPVELALEVKRRNMPVIAVTSLNHSRATASRHPSGKRLFEIADVVIDNCCPYGDTLFDLPGTGMKACSASSIAGMFIAQALTAEVIARLVALGGVPPIFISANVDGSDEHNAAIQKRYEGRI